MLLDLLLGALPPGEEVVGVSINGQSAEVREDGSGVVLRATTVGTLHDAEATRFGSWPRSVLLRKQWVGTVQGGLGIRMHLHSVDRIGDR